MLCLLQFPGQLLSNRLFLPALSSCATFLGCCSTSAPPTKHTCRESNNWFLFHDFSLNWMPHMYHVLWCFFFFFKFGSQSTLQLIGVIEFLTWKKKYTDILWKKMRHSVGQDDWMTTCWHQPRQLPMSTNKVLERLSCIPHWENPCLSTGNAGWPCDYWPRTVRGSGIWPPDFISKVLFSLDFISY